MIVVGLSIGGVAAYVEGQFSRKQPGDVRYLSFSEVMQSIESACLEGYRHHPYLATNNPEYDKRLMELHVLYKPSKAYGADVVESLAHHYDCIIETEPRLKPH